MQQLVCIKNHSPSDRFHPGMLSPESRFASLTKYVIYDLSGISTNDDSKHVIFKDDLGYCHLYGQYIDYFMTMEEWRNRKLDSVLNG